MANHVFGNGQMLSCNYEDAYKKGVDVVVDGHELYHVGSPVMLSDNRWLSTLQAVHMTDAAG